MTTRPLCIGLSLSPTWLRHDALNHSHYQADFYIDVVQQAEAAKLDFVFKPDSLTMAVNNNQHAPQSGSLDPMLLLSAIVTHTDAIGLVGTLSTTFVPPYLLARQMQSLHWLSHGRAGWNIVTSLDGAQAFGLATMPSNTQRYARAAECVELVRELWRSFHGNELRPVEHDGEYFRVNAVLNIPQHSAGLPPLFQAGASDAGRDFAASVADAVFASTPTLDVALALKTDLQQRAVAQGRATDSVRLLPGLHLFLADSREAAQELYQQTQATIPRTRRLAALSSLLGMDCSQMTDEQLISTTQLPNDNQAIRSRTHTDVLSRLIQQKPLTVGELIQRPEVIGSAHWVIVGTAADALTTIQQWYDCGAIDGFIALPGGSEASYDCFFTDLLPLLRQAGLFRRRYRGNTLIEHLQQTTLE